MTTSHTPPKKSPRGRKSEKAIALRRIQARDLLDQFFPAVSGLLAEIGDAKLGLDQIQARVLEMANIARDNPLPRLKTTFEDARSMNPEQSIARALAALGDLAASRLACKNLLAELDLARVSLAIEMGLIDNDEEHLRHELEAAVLTRPKIDREVEKRALEMERSGAKRANIIRDSQRADAAWARPYNWSQLPSVIGHLRISERPAPQTIAQELLPPVDDIAFYIDVAAVPQMTEQLDDSRLQKWYIQQVLGWLSRNYPGPPDRGREVIAPAWTALLMRRDRLFQNHSDGQTFILPSAWTPGRVMHLEFG